MHRSRLDGLLGSTRILSRMRHLILLLSLASVACAGLAQAQAQNLVQGPAPVREAAPAVTVSAAEAFANLAKYAGRELLIPDGEVVFASTHGALLRGGDEIFFELKPDMDADALKFMIATCSGPKGARAGCRMPVSGQLQPAVSPTTGWPVLARAHIGPR